MNPYSVTNPLNPTNLINNPVWEQHQHENSLEPIVSRAVYKLTNTVGRLLAKRDR